jgi:hypothetical protein
MGKQQKPSCVQAIRHLSSSLRAQALCEGYALVPSLTLALNQRDVGSGEVLIGRVEIFAATGNPSD